MSLLHQNVLQHCKPGFATLQRAAGGLLVDWTRGLPGTSGCFWVASERKLRGHAHWLLREGIVLLSWLGRARAGEGFPARGSTHDAAASSSHSLIYYAASQHFRLGTTGPQPDQGHTGEAR